MEKQPRFIKDFSKEHSAEERKETARQIKEKRGEHFEHVAESAKAKSEQEQALTNLLEQIQVFETMIEELSSSRLSKLKSYFELRKLKADLAVGQRSYEELVRQKDQADSVPAVEGTPSEFLEARQMLQGFYKSQKEKWSKTEYTKEDITKNFTEEHLALLSIEDYELLMRRFPNQMVAHVTRQGIRDHTGHFWHTAGAGRYSDGFMRLVADGRLRSPLGIHMVEDEKKEAIARFLSLDKMKTEQEALDSLESFDPYVHDQGSYSDRMAVHFATEEVADDYYGSEKGNEIFVAYPSAHVASQYYFGGQLTEAGGGYWNDQWVWANEERGMDLNAGVIFIPEQTKVDPRNGSRYELDDKGEPIVNQEDIDKIRKFVDWEGFSDFAESVMEVEVNSSRTSYRSTYRNRQRILEEKLEPFRMQMEEYGVTDRRLQDAVLSYDKLSSLKLQKELEKEGQQDGFRDIDSTIRSALTVNGIYYKEAKNTVNSKEFWENYFSQHPDKKPSKIVYYKEQDPTEALHRWKSDKGLYNRVKSEDVGFPERKVGRRSEQAMVGYDRFRSLAEEAIREHFAKRSKAGTVDKVELTRAV